ncbi:hypothetical protein M3Y94_00664800 [Aphelenchoides besseyi]|nr:hypothetical protein M3Y94_00664800 [Aphelenchoides besseyi]KAI6231271.1 hypothetical protein M3Y95_00363900 [Aphelenchoides besseyi]
MILMFDRGRLLTAFGLLTVIAVVVGDDDWGPTKKPDGVPDSYKAVEAGDFNEYLEMWSVKGGNAKAMFKSTYKEDITKAWLYRQPPQNMTIPVPIYNMNDYIYTIVSTGNSWVFCLYTYPPKKVQYIEWKYDKNNHTHKSILENRNYAFSFYNYIFVNSTHFFDALKIEDHIRKHILYENRHQLRSKTFPDIQYISQIPNILMTPYVKKQVMEKCNKKYCVLNMDHPGSGGILSSTTEHYVLFKHGLFLIINEKGNGEYYYTIKHADSGAYYYFPENMQTFAERSQKVSSDDGNSNTYETLDKLIWLIPIMKLNDKFFKRPDVQLLTTPRPTTTTTTTSTTTTTTTTRRPKTTTEVTTTTEKSPKLGIARAAVKEVCTTTPEPKKSSGYSLVVGFVSVGMAIVWFWAPIV